MVSRKHPLQAFREANGDMSQVEAAELFGITQPQLSRLENRRGSVLPKKAQEIAKLTGLALETVLNLDDNGSGATMRHRVSKPRRITRDMP